MLPICDDSSKRMFLISGFWYKIHVWIYLWCGICKDSDLFFREAVCAWNAIFAGTAER